MIEELAKKDAKWREIAFNICKCKMLADDLVQDMYLKLANKKKINDYYVAVTLKNLFIDHVRKQKNISIDNFYYLEDKTSNFEPTDEQQLVLNEFDKLDWVQKELLLERIDKSLRQIEKEFNINYGYTYRQTTEAKKKILDNLNKKK